MKSFLIILHENGFGKNSVKSQNLCRYYYSDPSKGYIFILNFQ